MKYYDHAVLLFKELYEARLNKIELVFDRSDSQMTKVSISSPDLKPGNEPRMYLHEGPTEDVIVLAHGLSDSPYYMSAVGKSFFYAGSNVILPLMPAHGLKNPDKAMEDFSLEAKWRKEMDSAVVVASALGKFISLGGFSKGGALSYNKILRDPQMINGGLFLFAAAIDVALIGELGLLEFVSAIAKITDGEIEGYGMDPYKYPKLPLFAALELGQIISENEELARDLKISQPVFAAHSLDDKTAKFEAVQNLVNIHSESGIIYSISNGMAHAELPLRQDIMLDSKYKEGKPAYRNPDFDLMMESCISFYKKNILSKRVKI